MFTAASTACFCTFHTNGLTCHRAASWRSLTDWPTCPSCEQKSQKKQSIRDASTLYWCFHAVDTKAYRFELKNDSFILPVSFDTSFIRVVTTPTDSIRNHPYRFHVESSITFKSLPCKLFPRRILRSNAYVFFTKDSGSRIALSWFIPLIDSWLGLDHHLPVFFS